jgi:glycerol-3-phosphate dehydrogenase
LRDGGTSAAARASRDYSLDERRIDGAPVISLLGGKLTAYRLVAEQAMDRAGKILGMRGGAWTASTCLPGGDLPGGDLDVYADTLAARYRFLGPGEAWRLAQAYGGLAEQVLSGAGRREDLGRDFGLGLSQREVDYLVAREWARTADDILWRRSKLGLRAPNSMIAALDAYLAAPRAFDPGL